MTLADPDTPVGPSQICIASLANGSQVACSGSTTQCVTNTVTPTVQNGNTVLAVGSCVVANALTGLTLTNSTGDYGGAVYWQLKKGTTNVGGTANVITVGCP